MKRLLILGLCMSFPVFGMEGEAAQQEEVSKKQLLTLLQEQVEWNKKTSATLEKLEQAVAAHEKTAEEREDVAVQKQAILFLVAPVMYYCLQESLKNLALLL